MNKYIHLYSTHIDYITFFQSDRKTTAIRRTAVREICVSRHHGVLIEPLPLLLKLLGTMLSRGCINWAPSMPRGVSL